MFVNENPDESKAVLGTPSAMHLSNCFLIVSLELRYFFFDGQTAYTCLEISRERAVRLQSICRHELFLWLIFLEIMFLRAKKNIFRH